jgi:DNA ligase (NAD+)
MGLGMKHVGAQIAELLALEAHDLHHLMRMKEEELLAIDGIGEKIAKSISAFFQDQGHLEEIRLLLERGVKPQGVAKTQSDHRFHGKTFVLTGSLHRYSRDEASSLIKERGGKVTGAVSRETDFVVVGEDPGSKYEKAKALNVPILSEEDFISLLKRG